MALNPQAKSELDKFTLAAKKVIYNPERMQSFMQMLGTPEGAITAVQSVISIIEKRAPVPPEILPLLGVNIYMAMVDVAQAATDVEADADVMKQVISAILAKIPPPEQPMEDGAEAPPGAQQEAPPGGQPPQGLLASMQGAPA